MGVSMHTNIPAHNRKNHTKDQRNYTPLVPHWPLTFRRSNTHTSIKQKQHVEEAKEVDINTK